MVAHIVTVLFTSLVIYTAWPGSSKCDIVYIHVNQHTDRYIYYDVIFF